MPEQDRQKWNARYADKAAAPGEPSRLVTALAPWLPRSGTALDVAGGVGRHAIWLAQRGLAVTLADIAGTGLNLAQERASTAGASITTRETDLETEPFPAGPWDLIFSFHYLWRPLFAVYPQTLAKGGLLVVIQPTIRNLERHAKPPPQYLLEDGELPTLATGLEILRYEEGWLEEGRHEAILIARRKL
jgi:tellurite methyltransferase